VAKFTNPIVHTNDPDTSGEAADAHEASGRRDRHANLVFALVQAHPGSTAVELWDRAQPEVKAELKERHEVSRRLSDLRAAGFVVQGEKRRCSVKGTTQVAWYDAAAYDVEYEETA
jgi:hypothetical protein